MPDLRTWSVPSLIQREAKLNASDFKADGWIARKYNMATVVGTILDPAADKTLMTTLVVTLTMKGMMPRMFLISI